MMRYKPDLDITVNGQLVAVRRKRDLRGLVMWLALNVALAVTVAQKLRGR